MRVTVCPPNKRTKPPRWGVRLREALYSIVHVSRAMPARRAEEYVLEVMCSGLAPLVFKAQRRGTRLPALAPRRHPCLYHVPERTDP